jgi:hypothetical protein
MSRARARLDLSDDVNFITGLTLGGTVTGNPVKVPCSSGFHASYN